MTPERWNYLKNLKPSPGRYFHVSCQIVEVPVPGTSLTRRVAGPGVTYERPETHMRKLRELTQRGLTL